MHGQTETSCRLFTGCHIAVPNDEQFGHGTIALLVAPGMVPGFADDQVVPSESVDDTFPGRLVSKLYANPDPAARACFTHCFADGDDLGVAFIHALLSHIVDKGGLEFILE